MGIAIITQGLSPVVDPIVTSHRVIGVVEALGRQHKTTPQGPIVNRIVRKVKASMRCVESAPKKYCRARSISYYSMSDGSAGALGCWMRSLKREFLCIGSMSELMEEGGCAVLKARTINVHPSLLPKFSGPNPYSAILPDEENETGPPQLCE